MKASVKKGMAASTPASLMTDYVTEHVSALMVLCGIKSVGVSKYVSGLGSSISTEVEFFDGAPKDFRAMGYVIKDSIGQIMAAANLVGIEVNMEDEEVGRMRRTWDSYVSNPEVPEDKPTEGEVKKDGDAPAAEAAQDEKKD